MPPLAKTLWAWACVVVGGAAVPGNRARSVWSVCPVGGRTGGPAPSLPSFPPPPRLPSLSGLLDRPSRWAALLKLGPESSLPYLWLGEDFRVRKLGGGKGGSAYHLPFSAQGHLAGYVQHQETKRWRPLARSWKEKGDGNSFQMLTSGRVQCRAGGH